MAIPEDMIQFLTRKYDIMQQEADARSLGARADANLTGVRAGLLPQQVMGANTLQAAQANLMGVQASLAPGELASQNALRRSQVDRNFSDMINADETFRQSRWAPGTEPIRDSFGLSSFQNWKSVFDSMFGGTGG